MTGGLKTRQAAPATVVSPLPPHAVTQPEPAGAGGSPLRRNRRGPRSVARGPRGVRRPPVLFVAPAIICLAAVVMIPTVVSVVFSFSNYDGGITPLHWLGFANYRAILSDSQAHSSITNTLKLAVFVLVLQNVIGLALALGLERHFRGRGALKAAFFLPVILSSIVVGYLWQYIYSPDGALNSFLRSVHLGSWQRPWLGDYHTALWAIGVTAVWQLSGYAMVIYSAGLQNVQPQLLEAAQLDGASAWQQVRYIKLPALAPAFTINFALSLITCLRLFDQIISMTNGGPGFATETVSTVIYKDAFIQGEYAFSAALSVVLGLIIVMVVTVQVLVLRRREQVL